MATLMATLKMNEAVVIETVSPRVAASPLSTRHCETGIGRIAAFENTTVLLSLLLVAAIGLISSGRFHVPDFAGLTGVLAMCAFVITRCIVLIAKKHEFQALSIVVMALLVAACA